MTKRIWDPENRYIESFLKEYEHWVLEVNYRQHTLGCYVIFAKRSVERISELTSEEIAELRSVMKEVEEALSRSDTFKPDRFNYMQLGNSLHHLHFHGIPRYSSPRMFDNKEWRDSNWGKVTVWPKKDISSDLVKKLKDAIRPLLG